MNRLHAAHKLPGHTNLTEWYIGDDLVRFGRSVRANDRVPGLHARYVLVVADEACGITVAISEAIETLSASAREN